jgi:hypothetical protein
MTLKPNPTILNIHCQLSPSFWETANKIYTLHRQMPSPTVNIESGRRNVVNFLSATKINLRSCNTSRNSLLKARESTNRAQLNICNRYHSKTERLERRSTANFYFNSKEPLHLHDCKIKFYYQRRTRTSSVPSLATKPIVKQPQSKLSPIAKVKLGIKNIKEAPYITHKRLLIENNTPKLMRDDKKLSTPRGSIYIDSLNLPKVITPIQNIFLRNALNKK